MFELEVVKLAEKLWLGVLELQASLAIGQPFLTGKDNPLSRLRQDFSVVRGGAPYEFAVADVPAKPPANCETNAAALVVGFLQVKCSQT